MGLRAKNIVCAGLMLGLIGGASVYAETPWEATHPRRDEVNGRLQNENRRINEGVATGRLTPAEANQLRREERSIRHQERRYARHHGSHISKAEQNRLNREENAVSHQIYEEKH